MAFYKVNGESLEDVADAIRTRGGTSSPLSFPDGFVSAIANIPGGGGGATLIEKSISANGTYNASSDNADGYSSVTVAVPSRLVIGTFEGTTADGAIDVTIPYSGNGFPIAGVIFPSNGSYKSGDPAQTLVQKNAIIMFSFAKNDISSTPNYSDNVEANQAAINVMYKSDASDPATVVSTRALQGRFYYNSNASNTAATAIRMKSKTSMSVYIAGSSYGLPKDIEFTYYLIYSE